MVSIVDSFTQALCFDVVGLEKFRKNHVLISVFAYNSVSNTRKNNPSILLRKRGPTVWFPKTPDETFTFFLKYNMLFTKDMHFYHFNNSHFINVFRGQYLPHAKTNCFYVAWLLVNLTGHIFTEFWS